VSDVGGDLCESTQGGRLQPERGSYPFWSLCVCDLSLIILYELAKAPGRRTTS
jgi:hypothetical protein